MLVQLGGATVAYFTVSIRGVDTSVVNPVAQVYRNGILTVVPVTATETATGVYRVDFTVPSTWTGYDQVHVRFSFVYNAEITSCTKLVGVVAAAGLDDNLEFNIDRILDLLEADETYDDVSGKARKLLRGTNTVLLEKDVVGSTCVDSVSISE